MKLTILPLLLIETFSFFAKKEDIDKTKPYDLSVPIMRYTLPLLFTSRNLFLLATATMRTLKILLRNVAKMKLYLTGGKDSTSPCMK